MGKLKVEDSRNDDAVWFQALGSYDIFEYKEYICMKLTVPGNDNSENALVLLSEGEVPRVSKFLTISDSADVIPREAGMLIK